MHEYDEEEHVKEVYARFGLAIYHAQVLEHALVNALVLLDLIPTRRHLASTRDEWGAEVDAFMDRSFQATMGRMMERLRNVSQVDQDLEQVLRNALSKRNWLAHHYFRERAMEFTSATGREQMLAEIDECREVFQSADRRLEETVGPLQARVGLTHELLEREYQRMLREYNGDI